MRKNSLYNKTINSKEGEMMKILTSREIQQKLKVGKSTLYQLLRSTDFPSYKIGTKYYATEEEIEKWIINKQNK